MEYYPGKVWQNFIYAVVVQINGKVILCIIIMNLEIMLIQVPLFRIWTLQAHRDIGLLLLLDFVEQIRILMLIFHITKRTVRWANSLNLSKIYKVKILI